MSFHMSMAMRSCGYCGLKRAQMRVLLEDQSAVALNGIDRWQSVVQCPDCAGITVIEHTDDKMGGDLAFRSYPADRESELEVGHLPDEVGRFYSNAQRALSTGLPDSAAVELRRTIEAAAAHFEVKRGVLADSIKELIKQGFVTKPFGDVLTHIRLVGNRGAHVDDVPVPAEAAEQALRFTTQLLRNLFEVPAELKQISAADGDTASPEQATPATPHHGVGTNAG